MSAKNRKITEMLSAVKKNSSSSSDPATSTSIQPSSSIASTADKIAPQTQTRPTTEIPHRPSKSFIFPKTKVGERSRSCQHIWFEKFPWLHYDTM